MSRCWEPDGPYVATADIGTKCPPRLTTGNAINIAATTATATVTTDVASGTAYVYVSTSSTEPSRKTLIAGTGASFATSAAVSATGSQSFAVTGLTAETQYYVYFLHVTTAGRPSNRIQIGLLTEPVSGPPATTVVAGYFWGTGGSDASAGTSHSTRWASMDPVSGVSPAIGTDVWGLAGSTHTVTSKGKVETGWAGSAGDYAEYGCYWRDGSTDKVCWEGTSGANLDARTSTPATLTTMGSLELPYIDGSLSDACILAKNCSFLYPITNECASMSDHLVRIKHSYARVRGMRIGESACRAVTIKPTSGSIRGVRILDSVIEQNGGQGTVVQGAVSHTLVKRSIYREMGKCAYSETYTSDHASRVTNELAENCSTTSAGHNGGLVFASVSSSSYSGINDVTFVRSYSEGIQCFNSTDIWMKGNRIYNTAFPGVYLDACGGAVVESNIVSPTNGDVGQASGDTTTVSSNWGDMSLLHEGTRTTNMADIVVRNNILVSHRFGMNGGMSLSANTAGRTYDVEWYHNTFIGSRERSINIFQNLTSANVLANVAKNNIFGGNAGSSTSRCFTDADTAYDYNLYGFSGIPAACKGANDVAASAATNPGLVLSHTSSAWAAHSHSNQVSIANAKLAADTNTGLRLNNVACISAADQAEYLEIAGEMDYPYDLDTDNDGAVETAEMTNWGYCGYFDFEGDVRGVSPNIGMDEY